MASIRLGRYEVEEEGLPAVCMRCGEPATVTVHKTFRWYPPWVIALIFAGLLPYVIVASILTKRMGVPVSFCVRHKRHWVKRGLLVGGTLMGLIICLVGVVALLATFEKQLGLDGGVAAGFLCIGSLVALVGWIILVVIVQQRSIHPTEITDHSITLTGLAPGYVEALRAKRQAAERADYRDDDYERRPPPRFQPRATDEFYDPDAPQPRPPETFRRRDG